MLVEHELKLACLRLAMAERMRDAPEGAFGFTMLPQWITFDVNEAFANTQGSK